MILNRFRGVIFEFFLLLITLKFAYSLPEFRTHIKNLQKFLIDIFFIYFHSCILGVNIRQKIQLSKLCQIIKIKSFRSENMG